MSNNYVWTPAGPVPIGFAAARGSHHAPTVVVGGAFQLPNNGGGVTITNMDQVEAKINEAQKMIDLLENDIKDYQAASEFRKKCHFQEVYTLGEILKLRLDNDTKREKCERLITVVKDHFKPTLDHYKQLYL